MDPMEIGFVKGISLDLVNILFMYGGYRLAKFTKRKQDLYFENGGSTDTTWGDFFVWVVSLLMALIVAWFLPLGFHKFTSAFVFEYRLGPFTTLAQYVLCLEALYIVIRGAKVILPIGRFSILVVLPIFLIISHFSGF